MKRSLHHPLWAHLPAVAAIGIVIGAILRYWPLPASVPVHFDLQGQPDRYGSPWEFMLAVVLIPLLIVAGSAILDEAWARQEQRKRFNWLSLLDDAVVAFLAAIAVPVLRGVAADRQVVTFDWTTAGAAVLIASAMAIVLEFLRPHRPAPVRPTHAEPEPLPSVLMQSITAGRRWVYYESQNPFWLNLVILPIALVLLLVAILVPAPLWVRLLNVAVAALIFALSGGMRTTVTPDRLTVRFGLVGLPVLRLRLGEIADAGVHEFAPLADFAGYGIRGNREFRKAVFLRGNHGVRLHTSRGRRYLVGSDHAERLAAVLQSALAHPRPDGQMP